MFKTVLLIDNYMYGGLADAELVGRRAHRRLVLDYVKGQLAGPLLDVPFHADNTPRI